ncbi:hypothetical protein Tco_0297950, partial [Tanacetum coccineum]
MSDSEHSTVAYTSISSDDGSLDVGSPRVIIMPPEDDVLLAEEQLLGLKDFLMILDLLLLNFVLLLL